MAKSFIIDFKEDLDNLLSKAKQFAEANKANFHGDHRSGRFWGNGIEGEYKIQSSIIAVTITRKPLLAPWSIVESEITRFFS